MAEPADHDGIDRLAEALRAASYDVESVQSLLGPMGSAALGRDDPIPALRATTGGSALETLVRLFLLDSAEPVAAVRAALPIDAVPELVVIDGAVARAGLDVRPYERWWVVSDVGTPRSPDHVLGVGGASVTLARATVPVDVGVAADVGTGCGVQALQLSSRARSVIATDVNPRALRLAAMTARLNGLSWELRQGDLLAPLSSPVDLLVSNPPFVVGPGRSAYTYRDSGLAGDAVCARLVSSAPSVLADGGWCQLLANWLHTDEPWQERVASWLPDDCDAWVVQREVQDPAEYVALWLADAGEEDRDRYDEWLSWFEAAGVAAVGFGLITLRRGGGSVRRLEELRQPIDDPLGPHVLGWFGRQDALAGERAGLTGLTGLAGLRLRRAAGVVLDRTLDAGPDGWQVIAQRVRQSAGLRRSAPIDDIAAALVAGCDGTRTVADLLAVLAMAYGVPIPEITAQADAVLRGLLTDGYLEPA